jgi:hypothetical protein
LIVTILACTNGPVLGSKVQIEIQNGDASVTVHSSIHQNFTRLLDQTVDVAGMDLSVAKEALTKALKDRSPSILISDVAIKIATSGTWLNVTMTFKAQNITSRSGKIMKVDCSWKSFNIPDDLKSHNVSYNMVGRDYVKPTVLSYANNTWARFYLDETRSVFYQDAADAAGNATLFDFTSLSKPLDLWNMTANMEEETTTWFFPAAKVFDLSATVEDPNGTKAYYAVIELSSEIVAPSFSRIEGDIIVAVQGDFEEPLMLSIVIAVLAVTLGLCVYEMKIRRKQSRARR